MSVALLLMLLLSAIESNSSGGTKTGKFNIYSGMCTESKFGYTICNLFLTENLVRLTL